jgi:DNA-directed RNA polymerase alpha subunit
MPEARPQESEVRFTVDDELFARINAAADLLDLSVAEWLALAARERLDRQATLIAAGIELDPRKIASLDILVSDLPFSVRARNCLGALSVTTVRDLVQLRRQDLLKAKNLGKGTLQEIEEAVTTLGLRLRQDQRR